MAGSRSQNCCWRQGHPLSMDSCPYWFFFHRGQGEADGVKSSRLFVSIMYFTGHRKPFLKNMEIEGWELRPGLTGMAFSPSVTGLGADLGQEWPSWLPWEQLCPHPSISSWQRSEVPSPGGFEQLTGKPRCLAGWHAFPALAQLVMPKSCGVPGTRDRTAQWARVIDLFCDFKFEFNAQITLQHPWWVLMPCLNTHTNYDFTTSESSFFAQVSSN